MENEKKISNIVKSFIPPAIYDRIQIAGSGIESFGERRKVTIIFADINGFTPLVEKLDAEKVLSIINSLFDRLISIIEKHGGTVDKYLGDAIMVLFGAPTAREDDRYRAILCAIDLKKEIERIRETEEFDFTENLSISIGINTGDVVTGLIGNDIYREYTVLGRAVNIASRLQDFAEDGEIIAGSETAGDLHSDFAMLEKKNIELKGIELPLNVFSIISRKTEFELIAPSGCITGDTFIGNQQKLDNIEKSLFGKFYNSLIVLGDAGAGKSFIANRVARMAHEKNYGIFNIKGQYWKRNSFLGALVPIVKKIIQKQDNIDDFIRDIVSYSRTLKKENIKGIIPRISGNSADSIEIADTRREEMLELFSSVLTYETGSIIIVDDLHYMDSASIEVLTDIADRLRVIIFSRESFEKVCDSTCFDVITLKPLSRRQVRDSIARVMNNQQIPGKLVDYIYSISQGMPGHIIEMINYLYENKLILNRKDAIIFESESDLPDAIDNIISARIDSLPEKLRQIVLSASVLGHNFTPEILDALHVGASEYIDKLVSLGIFTCSGDSYSFRWNAGEVAAYSRLLDVNKKALHQKAAKALEEKLDNSADVLHEIAHHYSKAGIDKKNFEYQYKAAMRELRFSPTSAKKHLEELVKFTDEQAQNWNWLNKLYDALTRLSKIYWYSGDLERFGAINLRASKIALELEDPIAFARAINGVAIANDEQGNLGAAYFAYQLALDSLENLPDQKALVVQIKTNLGVMLSSNGDLDGALSVYNSVRDDAAKHPEWPASPQLFSSIAWVYRQMDKLSDAELNFKNALEMDISQNNLHGQAMDHLNIAAVQIDRESLQYAKANLLKALTLFYRIGELRGRISTLNALGEVMRKTGDAKRAIHNHKLALKLNEKTDDIYLEFDACIELYRDFSNLGDLKNSQNYLDKAKKIAKESKDSELLEEIKTLNRI
ncbi:MAG: adenylate/guanylate cyclase domain-containing protein [Candidatus Zixiibacteriota bacterium]